MKLRGGEAPIGAATRWRDRVRFLVDQFHPLPSPAEAAESARHLSASDDELAAFEEHASFGLYESELEMFEAGILRSGQRVLDIGCGAGREALAFARRGVRVTAVDASAQMVERAKRVCASESVEFATVSLTDVAFEPRHFDVVYISSDVYQRTPGRAVRVASLERLRGIVRPGGAVVFAATVSPVESSRIRTFVEIPRTVARRYGAARVPERGDVFSRGRDGRAATFRHVFHSNAEILDEIRDAGLSPVAIFGSFFVARAPGGGSTYLAPPSATATAVGTGTLIADVAGGSTFRLNASGAAIWERLNASDTIPDVAASLAAQFGVEPGRIERDAETLVAELLRQRLLRERGGLE